MPARRVPDPSRTRLGTNVYAGFVTDDGPKTAPLAFLAQNGAQADVIEGLRAIASDWPTLYAKCPRGDWLLGIATRLGVPHTALVEAAVLSARTALDQLDVPAARRALDVAMAWSRGEASAAEVADASAAFDAEAARIVDPSSDAAARAVQAVVLGVTDPDVLASAPAFAAEATIAATMECGVELAMGWAHTKTAEAVRTAISLAELERAIRASEAI